MDTGWRHILRLCIASRGKNCSFIKCTWKAHSKVTHIFQRQLAREAQCAKLAGTQHSYIFLFNQHAVRFLPTFDRPFTIQLRCGYTVCLLLLVGVVTFEDVPPNFTSVCDTTYNVSSGTLKSTILYYTIANFVVCSLHNMWSLVHQLWSLLFESLQINSILLFSLLVQAE